MKKLQVLALGLSFLTIISDAMCGRIEDLVGLGIVDDSGSARANGASTLTIKDVLEESLLTDKENPYEGINLASNRLSVKGVKELVQAITNKKHTSNFKDMRYLNLTANPIDIEILEACKALLNRSEFRFLDIRETPALADQKFLDLIQSQYKDVANKIIFVARHDLEHFKDRPAIYDSHKKYFALNVWANKQKK